MPYSTKPQAWFWVLAIIFLLWNLMGIGAWTGDYFYAQETMNEFSPELQALKASYPSWYIWVFLVAVLSGLFACVALLFKKKIAVILSVISLITVVLCKGYDLSLDVWDVYDTVNKFFIIAVPVFAIALWLFTRSAKSKGWLR